MKVLHIASGDLWAGAEVQLYTLLTQLAHQTDVTMRAVLLNGGMLAQRLRSAGIAVDILDEGKMSTLAIIRELRRLLLTHKPDLIHTHRIKENLIGLAANALSICVPTVRTIHGANEHPAGWNTPARKLAELADELTGRLCAKQNIAVSGALETTLRCDYGYHNVLTVPNGIDIDRIRAGKSQLPSALCDRTKRHIGLIGRLEKVKRGDIFLNMAALLRASREFPRFAFHILGDGSCRRELEALASILGISGAVQFHGHQTDVMTWLANLDAIVICSDHEGLPMILLEAMAVGTPVVAHAVGGISEVMRDGLGGKLVFQHEARCYAAAVSEVLRHWTPADKQTALTRLEQHYSARRTAELTKEVYARCIGKRDRWSATR